MIHKVLVNDLLSGSGTSVEPLCPSKLHPEQMILFQTFKTQPVPRGGDKETVKQPWESDLGPAVTRASSGDGLWRWRGDRLQSCSQETHLVA